MCDETSVFWTVKRCRGGGLGGGARRVKRLGLDASPESLSLEASDPSLRERVGGIGGRTRGGVKGASSLSEGLAFGEVR